LAGLTVALQPPGGVRIERDLDGEAAAGLSREAELVIYRVAQEALTNVVRHAGARRACLRLTRTADSTLVEILDDGVGFDPSSLRAGAGLRGMRERALLIGARVEVRTQPGAGTAVRLGVRR
jgi:two-component system sensor histidine kinase UhpB